MNNNYFRESSFLTALFKALNCRLIKYCVLRNYSSLPLSTGGSDIDILIEGERFSETIKLIEKIALSYGGRKISILKADRVASLSICGIYNSEWWGVKFDTFSYVGTNGCDILPFSDVLERREEYNGVMVVDDQDGAIISYLKEVIGSGRSRKNYASEAMKAFSRNRLMYEKALKIFWGNNAYASIVEPLLAGKAIDLKSSRKRLKMYWFMNMLNQKPLKILKSRSIDFYYKILRIFYPLGYSVAFIGTDGSGKSTIIESIRPALESALHSKIKYEHMRPNILPSIARLLGGKPHEPGTLVTDPHGSTPSGFWGSLLRLCYYSLDYILGYWLKIYPDKVKKPCIYIFDRYFYDFVIDPVRSRISLPKKLLEWFQVIIPEPDLILCLGSDPEVIYDRKPELSLKEVTRQVNELRTFYEKTPDAVWVDTGLTVEESVNQALSAIVDRMAARYHG